MKASKFTEAQKAFIPREQLNNKTLTQLYALYTYLFAVKYAALATSRNYIPDDLCVLPCGCWARGQFGLVPNCLVSTHKSCFCFRGGDTWPA